MASKDQLLRDTLYFIAQKGWAETGNTYFNSLVEFLGRNLEVEYALVDELMSCGTRAKTIGLYSNGAVVHNIEYDLATTPCENVMNKRLCVYPQGVRELFPDDDLLVQMNAESYMGLPLWDSKGRPIGLIAILSMKPLQNVDVAKDVLQIVALRTAHAIERQREDEALAQYYSRLEETVKDRTRELSEANDRLAKANADISQMNDKLNTLIGIAYHDISNQLMVLQGTIQLLDMKLMDDREKEWIARMNRSLDVISRTVDLSKDYVRVGVNSPIWQEVDPILTRLSSPRISIDANVKGLSIYADPLLPKVFHNLLDNAEKHGTKADTVTVSFTNGGSALQLVWQDNGCGVPVEKKGTMFKKDPKDERVHGLYLISKILGVTGISIEENGSPNEGARFVMNIPPTAYRIRS